MNLTNLKLVTIISEPVLAAQIQEEIQALGSTGLTSTEVSGEGSRHLHAGEIPGSKIKIECVVDSPLASRILQHVSDRYFAAYSVIVYVADVQVLRGAKFRPG